MIRKVKKKDIRECADVIKESFLTVAEAFGFTPENALRFTAFSITADKLFYQLEQEHRPMYAAFCEDGSIIGYYSLNVQNGNECELNNLCVLPGYRHQHIGLRLLNDACAKARALGCVKLTIGIVEENTRLRKWYEENGFIHTGTVKFDFFPFTCGYMERKL